MSPMYHIFCEDKTKAQERLNKIYTAYTSNPDAILKLLEEAVTNCKKCFDSYIHCRLDMEIEKQRICLNFTPEKIYDWKLLFDEKIFSEYAACKNYPSAYTEFKGVIYLILQKIKNNEIWKKINLETIKLTQDEIDVLFGDKFERNIAYVKALIELSPLFNKEQSIGSMKILTQIYVQNKKDNNDLTEIRIEIIRGLFFIYNQDIHKPPTDTGFTGLSKIILEDLLEYHRADLIIKNVEMFEGIKSDPILIIKEIRDFNAASFMFLIKNIELIDFHNDVEYTHVSGLLGFLCKGEALREFKSIRNQYKLQLKILFRELALWVVKNIVNLDASLIEKLISIDFSVFEDLAYYLSLVNAFVDLKIPKVLNTASNTKARILKDIENTSTTTPIILDQSIVSEFIDDVILFKPHLTCLDDFACRFLSRVSLNYSTAIQFIKTFGNKRQFHRKIVDNLLLEGGGLENLLMILKLESPYLIKALIKAVKYNNPSRETIDILRKYDNAEYEENIIVSSDSENQERQLNKMTDRSGVASYMSHPKVILKQQSPLKNFNQSKEMNLPEINVKSGFVNIKRKAGDSNIVESKENYNKIELTKLKEIAAKINENNTEKEAVILDNSVALKIQNTDIRNTDVIASKSEINTQNTLKIGSSLASLITQKSKLAMCTSTEGGDKGMVDVDVDAFFEECLSPLASFSKSTIKEISSSFSSYKEYYDVFNPLRRNENIASIKSSVFENTKYFECKIHNYQRILRIRTSKFKFEVYDMLYFSLKKTYFNYSDIRQLEEDIDSGSFFGIVLAVYPDYFPNDPVYSDLVDIRVLHKAQVYSTDQSLFYRYNGNVVSSLREFNALNSIKESKILKYILRPSFLQDFLERKVDWDSKKLAFKTMNDDSDYTIKVNQNKNEILFQKILVKYHELNQSQARAVSKSFFSRDKFILIQGPPGTGKTTTILSIISTFLMFSPAMASVDTQLDIPSADQIISKIKILVCAPSNTAVDVITERLSRGIKNFKGGYTKIKFVRVGANNNPNIEQYTLEYLINCSEGISKHKAKQEIFLNASVICSTLSSSVSDVLNIKTFDLVIIDEACQATEISTIIPLKYNPSKIVLIGDPKQLPPTVISDQSLLKKSLFERLLSYHSPIFLDVQYRMHPEICDFSSSFFYDSKIKTSMNILKKVQDLSHPFIPLNFIDILKINEKTDGFKSFYNQYECKVCVDICKAICAVYGRKFKIVVLTPYKGQVVALMKNSIFENNGIEVNTIDGFQGQECDITIFSTVRQSGLGFICDFRRINVAMTRSRECVIVLGNKECLSKNKTWEKIIEYFISTNRYTDSNGVDEFLMNLFISLPPYNKRLNK